MSKVQPISLRRPSRLAFVRELAWGLDVGVDFNRSVCTETALRIARRCRHTPPLEIKLLDVVFYFGGTPDEHQK